MVAELMPADSETHGLVALMEIQASRMKARIDANGQPILLLQQNRGRWDRLLIGRGLAALARAQSIAGAAGPYQLQAAIAACHARARNPAETDWTLIAKLYAQLAEVMPSPVVELNRAVAVGMAQGAQAGLDIVERLIQEGKLEGYHLLPSVRGDLLEKLHRHAEAAAEFEKAARSTRNAREQKLLLERARVCKESLKNK
jgi:predicted RNA polymerase sigma factor